MLNKTVITTMVVVCLITVGVAAKSVYTITTAFTYYGEEAICLKQLTSKGIERSAISTTEGVCTVKRNTK